MRLARLLLLTLTTTLVFGCGRSELFETPPPVDAGVTIESGDDASGDAAPDSGPIEVAGSGVQISGVTDDGLIIFMTWTPSWEVWAVPFTGGAAPTMISPPGFTAPGDPAYEGGAYVSHHVVVMSMTGMAVGQPSSAVPAVPVFAWDERTRALTTFTPPPKTYGVGAAPVSADSQYIATQWENAAWTAYGAASRVDGSDSVALIPANEGGFDGDWLVYSTLFGPVDGGVGSSLIALDGAHGWSSVTLSTDVVRYAVDGIGARVLFSDARGLHLAPLDGSTPTTIDPRGGGSMLYLSPDSTFGMYMEAVGRDQQHVAAVNLPLSSSPGKPYPVTASTLSKGDVGIYFSGPLPTVTEGVLPHAPTGPVAIFTVTPPNTAAPSLALVGVGAGATAPNLALPYSAVDGFTSDGSRVLINRPTTTSTSEGTLTGFVLPDGPESAPLSTSSFGWLALGGSTILFTDNYRSGQADLRIADLAKGASSTLVVTGTTSYAVSPDHKLLAYVPVSTGGLWVTALPIGP
jgi:hypothetical protein